MQVSITYQEGQDMHERLSVVTRKGQITIPAEFRRALGLKEGDKARTAGIFKTDEPAKTAEELRVLAEEAIAADVMERSGGK
jgi:bifunctional DNA-binding transcriptional regulator/antitoxin component of YhaV-PrlF toxin-antitoxin module